MSRAVQDEKQLCSDLTSYFNAQKTFAKQQKIINTTNASPSPDVAVPKKAKRKAGSGSIWIAMKGGFSALNRTPKKHSHNAAFRTNLQATLDARREAVADAAAAAAAVPEEEPVAIEGEEEEEEDASPAQEEDVEEEEEHHAVPPIGASFADLVVRTGGHAATEGDALANDDEPTKCIIRVKSSRAVKDHRDKTKFTIPAAQAKKLADLEKKDPTKGKKAKRAAQRKLTRRLQRGSQRTTTSILSTQKAGNYFRTNIVQIIKREVVPFMEKKLTAAPTIASTAFSDVAPLAEVTAEATKKQTSAAKEEVDSSPAGKQHQSASSGKTKAQQKADGGGAAKDDHAKKGKGGGGGGGGGGQNNKKGGGGKSGGKGKKK